jgi:hypothetical protein
MDIKTFDDIVKLQEEFSKTLAARIDSLSKAATTTIDQMIVEKQAILAQSKADLDSVRQARTEAAKRLDSEIERRQKAIAQLERDLEAVEKTKRAETKAELEKAAAVRKRPTK